MISPLRRSISSGSWNHLPETTGAMLSNPSTFLSASIWLNMRQGFAGLPFLVVLIRYTLLWPCCSSAENLMALTSASSSESMYLLLTTGMFQSCSRPR